MITSLYLEGFKSFGKPVTIDFRDITLLYGENSSGKSTILQALQYAREVFCNGNLDCLKTEIGGDFVDLRGFDRFRNNRGTTDDITLGVEFININSRDDPCQLFTNLKNLLHVVSYASSYNYYNFPVDQHDSFGRVHLYQSLQSNIKCGNVVAKCERQKSDSVLLPVSSLPRTVSVRLKIGKIDNALEVKSIRLNLDGKPIICFGEDDCEPSESPLRNNDIAVWFGRDVFPKVVPDLGDYYDLRAKDWFEEPQLERDSGIATSVQMRDRGRESEAWDEAFFDATLKHETNGWQVRLRKAFGNNEMRWKHRCPMELSRLIEGDEGFIEELIATILCAPEHDDTLAFSGRSSWNEVFGISVDLPLCKDITLASFYSLAFLFTAIDSLRGMLKHMRYIGPLRKHYHEPREIKRRGEHRCWSDGLGAWDSLCTEEDDEIVAEYNSWLNASNRFGFEYSVIASDKYVGAALDELGKLSAEWTKKLDQLLRTYESNPTALILSSSGALLSSKDVGVGFSQVLPIVVASIGPEPGIVLLEQPELHIHVRLQAVLGDLLATSIGTVFDSSMRRQFIVETHSEALLLRLTRRIRETTKNISPNAPRLLCDHVAIYHISKQDGNSIAKKIELDTNGNLTDYWPDDLFDISLKERFGE